MLIRQTTKPKINSLFGIEAELEKRVFLKNFNVFFGVGISYLSPERYIDYGGLEKKKYRYNARPFLG